MPASSAFLRPYVMEMSKYTDAAPIFHKACAYTMLGAVLSKEQNKCVLASGSPHLWTNIYTVLVGESGLSHKGTAMDFAMTILRLIEKELVAPNDMSPEGLLSYLQARGATESGSCTILHQGEFVNLLLQAKRQYGTTLRPMLQELYDVPPTWGRGLRNKNSSFNLTQPRTSLLGGITADYLATYGSAEDWVSGFFNRCFFIVGQKVRAQEDLPKVPDAVFQSFAKKLVLMVNQWKESRVKLDWACFDATKAAEKAMRGIDVQNAAPQVREILARSSAHLWKIAALEQFDENPTAEFIGQDAVLRAREYVEGWQASVPELVQNCFTRGRECFEGDRLSRTILRMLGTAGESALEEIMKSCGLNFRVVDEAISSLSRAGLVVAVTADDGECTYKLKDGEPPENSIRRPSKRNSYKKSK